MTVDSSTWLEYNERKLIHDVGCAIAFFLELKFSWFKQTVGFPFFQEMLLPHKFQKIIVN